jgi:hypothetical protein
MGIGGAILIVGLRANHERGEGGQGALLVVGCSLAAVVAGAGVMLLADVARSLRRLSRHADRDAGAEAASGLSRCRARRRDAVERIVAA